MSSSLATFAHPAFAPYRLWLTADALPDLGMLNAWAREQALALPGGRALRFAEATGRGALAFESRVAHDGVIGVRPGSRHDLLNALAWLAFPRAKAALNARHVGAAESGTPNRRSPVRDAATLVDESGLILACADDTLVALLRAQAWRELFIARRDDVVRATRALVLGHGLLAKLATPFRAITARTLVVAIDPASLADQRRGLTAIDAAAADAIAGAAFTVGNLPPLPVAALPGWDAERLGDELFADRSVFRPRRV